MEQHPSIPMERTGKILRRSVHIFLQNYQHFTITASLLAFSFSAAFLVTQVLIPISPLLPQIHYHLQSLFDAAGFPSSSEFFAILSLKLSETVTSSILTLPFTLSFLLLAKSSVVQVLSPYNPSFPSFFAIYSPILLTHVYNSFVILSVNATSFSCLFLAFNFLEGFSYSSPASLFLLSVSGAVLYSVFLANALVTCNLALVSSGMERRGGFLAILKACVLIRGRTSTALILALPFNIAQAAIEALFQYRVVRAYYQAGSFSPFMAFEGMFIAYLYSIVLVLDTILSCVFFKSCKAACRVDQAGKNSYKIDIEGQDCSSLKNSEDVP